MEAPNMYGLGAGNDLRRPARDQSSPNIWGATKVVNGEEIPHVTYKYTVVSINKTEPFALGADWGSGDWVVGEVVNDRC